MNGYPVLSEGSIAGATFLALRELLRRGHEVTLFSKRSFIYPESLLREFKNLNFVDTTNSVSDRIHEYVGRPLGAVATKVTGILNQRYYREAVLREMRMAHDLKRFDVCWFAGLPAMGRIDGLPTVSSVQGAAGSDVRSLDDRRELLNETESKARLALLRLFGWFRMRYGMPDYSASDVLVTGSSVSGGLLRDRFAARGQVIVAIPYAMNLSLFALAPACQESREGNGRLRVLWLGRIVPRKRLDVLLEGCRLAIRSGCDLEIHLVGSMGFAPGLQKLIDGFPYPERLKRTLSVPRRDIPALLSTMDVLIQPSDEEDFGSSVAEAMACGVPCIVGATNGTADYIDDVSVQLPDDRPESLADAIAAFARMKQSGELKRHRHYIRSVAEKNFSVETVVDQLESVMREVIANQAGERHAIQNPKTRV